MHRRALVGVSLSCLSALAAQQNFPAPPAPAGNPVTTEKALLGMALFFEEPRKIGGRGFGCGGRRKRLPRAGQQSGVVGKGQPNPAASEIDPQHPHAGSVPEIADNKVMSSKSRWIVLPVSTATAEVVGFAVMIELAGLVGKHLSA